MQRESDIPTENDIINVVATVKEYPLCFALTQNGDRIRSFTGNMPGQLYSRQQKDYIQEEGVFLVDVIAEAGSFALGYREILAIWGSVVEMFPDSRLRYLVASTISSVHAVEGLEGFGWKGVPRHYFQKWELPEIILQDRDGLLHVKGQLDEIEGSFSDLCQYVYQGKLKFGQPIGQMELLEDSEGIKRRMSHLPGGDTLFKNFREGWGPFYGDVSLALKILERKAAD